MPGCLSPQAMAKLRDCHNRLTVSYGEHISEEMFLSGPLRQSIEISEDNATEWFYGLEDIHGSIGLPGFFDLREAPHEIAGIALLNPRPLLPAARGYEFHAIVDMDGNPLAQLAIDVRPERPEVAGYYLGSSLHIAEAHRGRGLARSLVAAQILDLGGLELWSFGISAFSPGGLEAHRSAYRQIASAWEYAKQPQLQAA